MKNQQYLAQNMADFENLKIFDNNRPEFKPYGFTNEKWKPNLMPGPDRHNELKLIY
jgi:hypothetical protein